MNPKYEKKLRELFILKGKQDVDALINACQSNKISDIEFHVHRLKGSSNIVGATRLFTVCNAIEQCLSSKNTTKIKDNIPKLNEAFEAFKNN